MIGVSSAITALYLHRTTGAITYALAEIEPWYLRLTLMQLGISTGWGVMPWLLWEQHHAINHLFLAASSVAVIAGMVVARGSNRPMFLASLLPPITVMRLLSFAFGNSGLDWAIAVTAPNVAAQMWFTGRPLVVAHA